MKFVFILTIVLILGLSSCKSIIGLNPAYQRQYEGKVFKCDSEQKEIPIGWVNDNYCDCKDGTDEPGTSACSNGRFYCKNEKFHPQVIPSQWVNDGVCDCCDGSDEYTTITCKDTCKDELRKEYNLLLKEIKTYKTSLQTKNEWVQYAKQFRDKVSQEDSIKKSVEKLEAELTALTQKLQDIKMEYYDIEDEASIHDKINFYLSKTLQSVREFFSFIIPTERSRLDHKIREYQQNRTRDKDILEKIGKLKEEHYGSDDVLLKLIGKVYSVSNGRHSYTLFPFSSAKQSTTSLGKWNGWKDKTTMYYDEGDACPNGVKRNSTVKIVCREKDELISVEEPTTCAYHFVLGLPSECTEEGLKELEEKAKKYKF